MMRLGPLTTTSIGSFPRPHWLADTERNRVTFRLEGEALREAQDDATIVTLREQEEIGLDLLTDGEQRREGFIFHMTRTWDGIDLVNQAPTTRPLFLGVVLIVLMTVRPTGLFGKQRVEIV